MMIAVACGNDDDSEDAAQTAPAPATEAPEPEPDPAPATEAPEPEPDPAPATEAPEPEPETTSEPLPPTQAPEPPVSLEGFVVDADTTGGDLLDGVSKAEASCVSAEAGDGFQPIVDTTLMDGGNDPSVAGPLAVCLTEDNFVVFSTAVIAANGGAQSDESRNCLTNLGRERPEFAYVTFGVLEYSPTPFEPAQLTSFAKDFYNCFAPDEQVRLTVRVMDEFAATAPMTADDFLTAMGDDAVNCYLEGLGMSREQFGILMETAFAAGTASTTQGPDCLDTEDITEILITLISRMMGELTDETKTCIRDFSVKNPEYLEILALGDFDSASMSEEEFAGIIGRGLDFYDCLTESELLPVQALIIQMVT